MKFLKLAITVILLLCCAFTAWAETEVYSINVSPDPFNIDLTESATITVEATEGLSSELTVRIFRSDQTTIIASNLSLTEVDSGVYTCLWGGTSLPGTYYLRVFNLPTATYIGPWGSVEVQNNENVTSVTAVENPFIPTGTNSLEVRVEATPGQTGLYLNFTSTNNWNWNWNSYSRKPRVYLTETSTPGVYVANWNPVGQARYNYYDHIWPNHTYRIQVYDSTGNVASQTGSAQLTGVQNLAVSPSPFTPGGSNRAVFTATGAGGLHLEAKIFNSVTHTLTRTISLTEASGVYSGEWDGKDYNGNFAGSGTYNSIIYNADSGIRYYPSRNLNVNAAIFSISASPDPYVPDGSNKITLTVRADPLQSGLYLRVTDPQGRVTSNIGLFETGSEGTYTAQWNGLINSSIVKDGECAVRVYDASGNQFPSTGNFTVSSVKSLSVTPNPFSADGSNNVKIAVQMVGGFNLETRIGSIATLDMTETAGEYAVSWDGKNTSGAFVPSGTYSLTVWNKDTGVRYDLQSQLVLEVIDTLPPQTSIVSGPTESSYVNDNEITFAWSGSDNMGNDLTYSYKLDDGIWTPFDTATEHTFIDLAEGEHAFSVKARDASGNEDDSPVVRTFTVDRMPPEAATNLQGVSVQTGIQVTWQHSASADIHAYKLYWDNGSGLINYNAPYATIYYPDTSN